MPSHCVLPPALTAITRTVTVAAGRFAPGHLGELPPVAPFELVDAILEETGTVQRRLRDLPSRVGIYFLLDPAPGAAPGTRESHLGLPPHPRRTPRARHQDRRIHGVADPPGRRDRPGTRAHPDDLVNLLRSQADAFLACDFFEASTLNGTRLYVLAVIEHASRRVRVLGSTAHPTTSWVTQAARNLVMDLENAGSSLRFFIRDRDGKYPALFDAVLADAGIQVVLSGVRIPQMNAIMDAGSAAAAENSSTAPSSGTNSTYSTRYASTSSSTTTAAPTKASTTPDHCDHQPPTKRPSPTSTSANGNDWAASSSSTTTPPDQHG
nr:transposase domain-containing protein [Saccharothrix sp. NRRL B-16348]